MAPKMKSEQRDMAHVYDKAAKDFRKKAPELLTYKYIVRPALETALDENFPPEQERESVKVLDIGSASGRNVRTLIQEGFSPKNIFGVEISAEQVAIAQKEIPEANFAVGDISNYKLPKEAYDLAIMVMVPEFLDEEKYPAALENIHSSIKDEGVFVYITTHPDRYTAKYGIKEGEVTTHGPWSEDEFSNYVRSVEKQVEALKKAGFEVQSVEELYLTKEVDEQDRARRADFKHDDNYARLTIVARKAE